MEVKDLIDNLKHQKKNLSQLLNAASLKQKALVQLNYEDLEKSISTEERTLVNIQQAEKHRISILSELYLGYSIRCETPKLSEFIEKTKEHIGAKTLENISSHEKELKKLIKQISVINQQNKYLIENSRAFIKETITSLLNKNKSLLDRRV
jgi:hypothetical protein